jgi:hypothetical protein
MKIDCNELLLVIQVKILISLRLTKHGRNCVMMPRLKSLKSEMRCGILISRYVILVG